MDVPDIGLSDILIVPLKEGQKAYLHVYLPSNLATFRFLQKRAAMATILYRQDHVVGVPPKFHPQAFHSKPDMVSLTGSRPHIQLVTQLDKLGQKPVSVIHQDRSH